MTKTHQTECHSEQSEGNEGEESPKLRAGFFGRGVYPEPDSSVASLLQNDRGRRARNGKKERGMQ